MIYKEVKKYCKNYTEIENYDKAIADTTQTWQCHHRLETHNSDGERRLVDLISAELIALGMYFDRPADELIFLTKSAHVSLHKKGRQFSDEHRKKMSAAQKGKRLSEEVKRKISEALKGKPVSEETKKKLSDAKKECKRGPMSEETKKKISEKRSKLGWRIDSTTGKRVFFQKVAGTASWQRG